MSDFAISNLPNLVAQASITVSSTELTAAPSDETTTITTTDEVKVDLRQALSFVIDEESGSNELSEEDLSALEQRRLDLIMWLLNLELRLSPYTSDFA